MVSSFLEGGDFDRRCTISNNDSTVMEATTPAEAAARIRNSVTINPDMRVLQGSYIQPNSRAATQMITARFRKAKLVREPQPSSPSRVPGETRWRKPCVDYSLETYRSRPAQVGERYETHQFPSFSFRAAPR